MATTTVENKYFIHVKQLMNLVLDSQGFFCNIRDYSKALP